MSEPVYKDTAARYTTIGDSLEYNVKVDNQLIYQGRLTKQPGNNQVWFYINRLAKDYLSSKIDYRKGTIAYQQPYYKRKFELSQRTMTGDPYYEIYNDWSYEPKTIVRGLSQTLSRPISNIVDPRQILFSTMAYLGDGVGVYEVKIDYCHDGRCFIGADAIPSPCVTFALPVSGIEDGVDIDVRDEDDDTAIRYKVKKTSATHCLYYLNAHGGYDHLLVNGTTLRTDAINRTEMTRDVDNTTLTHGRECIWEEITPRWTLNTDYLTDEQWAKTHNLLGSTHVLLHDLTTDEITPVVITANEVEYKTYRNQGNKKSYLTIEVEASVKRMRR